MAESLTLSVTQQTLDNTGEVIVDQIQYSLGVSYTEKQIGMIVLPSSVSYVSIPFVEISSAKYLRINSTKSINIRINGGSEDIPVTSDFIITTAITGLTIQNNSGSNATIQYDLRG